MLIHYWHLLQPLTMVVQVLLQLILFWLMTVLITATLRMVSHVTVTLPEVSAMYLSYLVSQTTVLQEVMSLA